MLFILSIILGILAPLLNVILYFGNFFDFKHKISLIVVTLIACTIFLFVSAQNSNQFSLKQEQYLFITVLIILGFYRVSGRHRSDFIPLTLFFLLENLFLQNTLLLINLKLAQFLNFIFQIGLTILLRNYCHEFISILFETKKKWFSSVGILSLLIGVQFFYQNARSYNVDQKFIEYTKIKGSIQVTKKIPIPDGIDMNQLNQSFMIFVIAILIIGIYINFEINKSRKNKSVALEKEMMASYIETLEKMQLDIQKVQHDYKNMLIGINGYIDEEHIDRDGLKKFLTKNELRQNNVQIKTGTLNQLSKINIPIIKGMVSTKIIEAVQKNISVVVECQDPINILKIDPFDLARAIGIIMDNAIEECEQQKTGEIRITFIDEFDKTVIIIANTCSNLITNITKGKSTKGDNRGFGLINLQEIVESSHSISLISSVTDRLFTQKLTIRK